jgi:formamidopyrimidine-DNA glycosylase
MPELPEVETSRRGIEPHLVGQRLCTRLCVTVVCVGRYQRKSIA